MLAIVSGITLVLTAIITINNVRKPLSRFLGSYLFRMSIYYDNHLKIVKLEENLKNISLHHHRFIIIRMIEREEPLDHVLLEYDIYKELGGNGYVEEIVSQYKIKRGV